MKIKGPCMFTHTTPSWHKSRSGRLLLLFSFVIMSFYPVYRNFYYSNGIKTYERHIALLKGQSEFYNPWQYRVLCPYTIEGLMWLYNNTIDKVFPIEQKFHFSIQNTSGTNEETDAFVTLMQTPGAMKYMILFILFRALEHFIIFLLVWKLWCHFIENKWLIFFGICFITLAFGNAVTAADLSFNTYMDIILYLLTALLIVKNKNVLWIIPLSVVAAFNRETGIMIPLLFFASKMNASALNIRRLTISSIKWPPTAIWFSTAVAYILFFTIFLSLRQYYGYQPQQVWKAEAGWPMLKLNLFSAVAMKDYMELLGTFAVIPLILLYNFKQYPYLLKKWFLVIVPVWFAIHYISVVVYQTRLFMVPMVVIIMPMLLLTIENYYRTAQKTA